MNGTLFCTQIFGGEIVNICSIAGMSTLPGARENRLSLVPLGRIGQVDDIANVAYFFASPEAGYMTGQSIFVDGGMCLTTFDRLG